MPSIVSHFVATLRTRFPRAGTRDLFPFELSITMDDVMEQLTLRSDLS